MGTIIVAILVLLAVVGAIKYLIKQKALGGCAGCSGCSHSCQSCESTKHMDELCDTMMHSHDKRNA
ncbi:MAG: FeoB-associated Cys-rich membrane protein [Eggerthellaceae bacterium]|nr:FeoB-associated Cys-rich membrane protein [Eggerthellaceae bacterium]MCH4221687.1 FeoB-associated Cys-rich membrane protein [Eggerthellaceae bacterium]